MVSLVPHTDHLIRLGSPRPSTWLPQRPRGLASRPSPGHGRSWLPLGTFIASTPRPAARHRAAAFRPCRREPAFSIFLGGRSGGRMDDPVFGERETKRTQISPCVLLFFCGGGVRSLKSERPPTNLFLCLLICIHLEPGTEASRRRKHHSTSMCL